jgi:endo-1,4-beta-D-glucanase Y
MKFQFNYFSFIFLLAFSNCYSQDAKFQFPQHIRNKYDTAVIYPDNVRQFEMDSIVIAIYKRWKKDYLIDNDCNGSAYIFSYSGKKTEHCVSEAMGYGMIIVALMAQRDDPDSKQLFDRLYFYVKRHPSVIDSEKYRKKNYQKKAELVDSALMAWEQKKICDTSKETSATDADMDIAYALLLADAQWGSNGEVNYLNESKIMLEDIIKRDINPVHKTLMLGNSIEFGEYGSWDSCVIRTSDFMPSHFREFESKYPTQDWAEILKKNYELYNRIQVKFSPNYYLFPDFVDCGNDRLMKPKKEVEIRKYDFSFYDNACRVPWRIGLDFILAGDFRAKNIIEKFNDGMISLCKGDPREIHPGYPLNGDLKQSIKIDPTRFSYYGPFAVSAMIDKKYQPWLDNLWKIVSKENPDDAVVEYYDRTIQLISLIIISGNYWTASMFR